MVRLVLVRAVVVVVLVEIWLVEEKVVEVEISCNWKDLVVIDVVGIVVTLSVNSTTLVTAVLEIITVSVLV